MIVQSRAPNRILDFGGWTDTHFAGSGCVVNLAVNLYAHVTVRRSERQGVTINIQDYGEKLRIDDVSAVRYTGHHDLLKAALKVMGISGISSPEGGLNERGLEVAISADVPPGCGTGSSAAISVALLNALGVVSDTYLASHEIAHLAHRLETKELGYECGLQDQYASAYGGLNFIDIPDYPIAHVSPVPLSSEMTANVEAQLLLVYEGKGHLSSDVHRKVIENLSDPESSTAKALDGLKQTARVARKAFMSSDIFLLAAVMDRNNELQKQLHPDITTANIEKIEEIGRSHGAIGAMINGAGGGGSICLLCEPGRKIEAAAALRRENFRILPFSLSPRPAEAWIVPEQKSSHPLPG